MGLLNKDTNPVVTHAITSNDKFREMKTNLDSLVNNAQAELLRIEDENFAVKAQKDYLERLNLKEEQKNIENKMYVEKQLNDGIQKLRSNQSRLQQLRVDAAKTTDVHAKLKTEFEDLNIKDKTKHLLKGIDENLSTEGSKLNAQHFEVNETKYLSNKGKLE